MPSCSGEGQWKERKGEMAFVEDRLGLLRDKMVTEFTLDLSGSHQPNSQVF